MASKFNKYLSKTIEYLTYLFAFIVPWQTKLILRSSDSVYSEINFYFSHALMLIIFSLFVWLRFREGAWRRVNRLFFFPLGALGLLIAGSILVAPDKILASYYYFIFLAALSLFFVVRVGTEQHNYEEYVINRFTLAYSFLAGMLAQALLGIYQFLTQSSFACKYLGLAAHDPIVSGTAVIETMDGRWLRAYGGLDHPNVLGGALAISLILAAYLLIKKKVINSQAQAWTSVFLFIFYFIALYALLFSFSRAAWLAFVLGLVVLLIRIIRSRDKWAVGRLVALIIFSVILVFLTSLPFKDLILTRVEVNTRLEQQSVEERQSQLVEAGELIKSKFITGVGVGNYQEALAKQDDYKKPLWAYQPVHNVFLLLWAQSGLLSLVAFAIFVVFLLKYGRRDKYSLAIALALFILAMLDHWLLSLPFGVLFLFLILALI